MDCCYIAPFTSADGFAFNGAHLFSVGERAVLISGRQGTSLWLSTDMAEQLRERRAPGEGFRLKLLQSAMASYRRSREPIVRDEEVSPVFFMVDLTKRCCLACRYCFRDFADRTEISEHRLESICAFILRHARECGLPKIYIQAWGGEPSMAMEKIRFIHRYFSKAEDAPELTLCLETNAAMLTQSLVEELRDMKVQLGISLDGPPDLHNAQRPFTDGRGSYERVVQGMRRAHEQGFLHNHQGICVVTRRSLGRAKEIVHHFACDLGLRLFKFGIIKENEQMAERALTLTAQEAHDFSAEMAEAVIELNRSGVPFTENNLRVRLQNLLTRGTSDICSSRGCMGGRKLVAFDQQGYVFSCELMDMRQEAFGHIDSGLSLVEMVRLAQTTHPFFRPKTDTRCATCPWYFFCRGGCTSAVRCKTGTYTGGIDEIGCAVNCVLYPRLVKLLLTEPELALQMAERRRSEETEI